MLANGVKGVQSHRETFQYMKEGWYMTAKDIRKISFSQSKVIFSEMSWNSLQLRCLPGANLSSKRCHPEQTSAPKCVWPEQTIAQIALFLVDTIWCWSLFWVDTFWCCGLFQVDNFLCWLLQEFVLFGYFPNIWGHLTCPFYILIFWTQPQGRGGGRQTLKRTSKLGSNPPNVEPTYSLQQVNLEVTPLIWSPMKLISA